MTFLNDFFNRPLPLYSEEDAFAAVNRLMADEPKRSRHKRARNAAFATVQHLSPREQGYAVAKILTCNYLAATSLKRVN